MSAICLCYEVHEPYQLRRYTVFDMGQNSIYEDDDHNCDAMLRAARLCYLPANELMLKLIRRYDGAFRLSYAISGTALDLFEQYVPEVLDSFVALARTGCVEFVAQTAPHSLAFLYSRQEFDRQVQAQAARLKTLFGYKPVTFKNTECVYNNDLAAAVAELGFKAVLAEGTDHVLGWRSANYIYEPVSAPGLALLLRNTNFSGDMGVRFSDSAWPAWPLKAETFASWCHGLAESADIINIINDYHIFGMRHSRDSGIFDFMEALPEALLARKGTHFTTPATATKTFKAVGAMDVPQFMSWEDESGDLTAWLGNDMQKDAIHALYALSARVAHCGAPDLRHDFDRLQTADHFRHMSTKWFSSEAPDRPSPFGSPYDAYITFMNVLADFEMRLKTTEELQTASDADTKALTKSRAGQSRKPLAEAPEKTPGKNKSSAKTGAKPDAKSGPKAGAKAGTKTGAKAGAKTGAKTGTKTGAKDGANPTPKPGAKADMKPDAKAGAKPGPKSDTKSDTEAGAKVGAKTDAKAGAKAGDSVTAKKNVAQRRKTGTPA